MPRRPFALQGTFPPPSLLRRFAAMGYDALSCLALLIVTTFMYKLVQMSILGESRLRVLSDAGALDRDPLLSALLALVLAAFFAAFWTRTGQTLGMQAWGIRVQKADGTRISLKQAALRLAGAGLSWLCLGAGFLWSMLDKGKRSWPDLLSGSQLVHLQTRR